MQFEQALSEAVLIRRYKRFLADVELPDGGKATLHCPNTGSMKNCQQPGSRIWYTVTDNPKRKYPGTWQIIEVGGAELVGINTSLANKLVAEAIEQEVISRLAGYGNIRREVPYGADGRSRIDLLLCGQDTDSCYVEIKNVSLGDADRNGFFPDAVTLRGQKHLEELIAVRQQGDRAVLFFCVQHTGIDCVAPADDIDPAYGALLRQAADQGVEILAYGAEFDIDRGAITLNREIPVLL